MRISLPPDASRSELSVVPLVNIVFLLLVFFMLVGRIVEGDPIPISPPVSNVGEPGQDRSLVVLIDERGVIALEGEDEPVSRVEIIPIIAGRISSANEIEIRIKADARLSATYLITLMEELRSIGVSHLSLITIRDS